VLFASVPLLFLNAHDVNISAK